MLCSICLRAVGVDDDSLLALAAFLLKVQHSDIETSHVVIRYIFKC